MNIELVNVSKKYNSTSAVKKFTAKIEDKKMTTLLGPSGCGKSTLLNILAGVIKPTEGKVIYDGEEINDLAYKCYNIGYVFQDFSLYPNMTAFENIQFPLENISGIKNKHRKKEIKERVYGIAEMLKIENVLNHYPNELSGGQQQRVAIGRAIVRRPDLLLMDEPFANLDKKLASELRDEIRQIQLEIGITTVFVTHNQNDASAISDKIIVMNSGEIQQIGNTRELYQEPQNLFVAGFIGENGVNIIRKEQSSVLCNDVCEKLFFCESVHCIGIRSEDIVLTEYDNEFKEKFEVEAVIDNGFYYTIKIKSSTVVLRAYTENLYKVGSVVGVIIRGNVLRFDKNDRLMKMEGLYE